MTARLDHANLLVRDVDATIRFLRTALPELQVRGGGGAAPAERWVHLGTEHLYLALEQATAEPAERWVPYGGRPGTNHLGFEVDDVAAVRARLRAAGYRETTYPNAHPYRTRVYFRDAEGNDWEFVEYRSGDPAKRHDYTLPDRGPRSRYDALDEALHRLVPYGPDLANGMTSHAPMTAEALCALGRPGAVMPWLERYGAGLLPAPPPREPIAGDRWREALAREDRFSDWATFFRLELAEAPWRDVLERWVSRLAPGLCAAATHGVIRAGHAARSLAAGETPLRLGELADALASWASTYQELPTRMPDDALRGAGLAPRDAIARVALVPRERRRFEGTIVSSLAHLDAWPAFADTIGLLDASGDPEALASELAETFARVYLANARDTLTSIVFVHGVTAIEAVTSLLPNLRDETRLGVLRFGWQAACGLYAAFGSGPPIEDEPPPSKESWEELADEAIAHGDEHAIKLAAACRLADARRPSPCYAAAVRRAVETLPRIS